MGSNNDRVIKRGFVRNVCPTETALEASFLLMGSAVMARNLQDTYMYLVDITT